MPSSSVNSSKVRSVVPTVVPSYRMSGGGYGPTDRTVPTPTHSAAGGSKVRSGPDPTQLQLFDGRQTQAERCLRVLAACQGKVTLASNHPTWWGKGGAEHAEAVAAQANRQTVALNGKEKSQ